MAIPLQVIQFQSNSIMHYQTTDELVAATNTSTLEEYHPAPAATAVVMVLSAAVAQQRKTKDKNGDRVRARRMGGAQARAGSPKSHLTDLVRGGKITVERGESVSSVTGWVALSNGADRVLNGCTTAPREVYNLAVVGPQMRRKC